MWRALAREPVVHFLALGAVLFAIDAWRAPGELAPPREPPAPAPPPAAAPLERRIAIDARVRAAVADHAARRLGHPPTAAERDAALEQWIDDEIMAREGTARGLDRDDPVIRDRIASQMRYVLEQGTVVPEPSEAELAAWFEAHRDAWSSPERVDFTHVFVAGTDPARVDPLAAALAGGAPPETLGDTFSGGRHYRGRTLPALTEQFGAEFVAGLDRQPIGAWQRRRSRHGWHLVRLDRVVAARAADFATARLDAAKTWRDAQRARAVEAEVHRLRAAWKIER
jgi:hypothetical protein